MELSKYCVDHGNKIAIKAFVENIHPKVLQDLKKYSVKGKMTTELALQFGSLSYDIIESFISYCTVFNIAPSKITTVKILKP